MNAPAVRLALCIQALHLNRMTRSYDDSGRYVTPIPNDFYSLPTQLVDRAVCETDETTLQLLPYLVLQRPNGDIFNYARGKGGAEARLVGNLSIGVGGHVDEEPQVLSLYELLQREAKREASEEVGLNLAGRNIEFNWLIRDYSNPVGRVHLGIVALIQVNDDEIESKEPGIIDSGDWSSMAELRDPATYNRLESWSQAMVSTFSA